MAVQVVELVHTTLPRFEPFRLNTVAPAVVLKPVPVMVSVTNEGTVLELFGILFGEMLVMVGKTTNVKGAEDGELVIPPTVTVGCTTPAACFGEVNTQLDGV